MEDRWIEDLRALVIREPAGEAREKAALERILARFACVTGTLHRLDEKSGLLRLVAAIGLPPTILPQVQAIPIGKGMAGIAAERRAPVQVCNLQTDDSGVVRPAARDTKVAGAITVPILRASALLGTLGIARREPHEFSAADSDLLLRAASAVADHW
ncbi:MAG: GAF domain-containing protein [Planctomycetes bacterium]|nr:GAF domain-containing protein [Planctomycetota bacterium]